MCEFRIGDQALLVSAPGDWVKTPADPYFGQVVTVISGPLTTPSDRGGGITVFFTGGYGHMVRASDGAEFDVGIICLQKLPPAPEQQVTTWDDVIVWRPRELSHV